ncbi:hypothetical protein BH10PAT3_BH10PAT3_6810 [soil metagenome]
MGSPNTQTLIHEPDFVNEAGDVMPGNEYLLPRHDGAANAFELYEDHANIASHFDQALIDPNPGPSTDLMVRDDLLMQLLDASASAMKAQGRAKNYYNNGQIGKNMKIAPSEVRANGEAMLPEHMGHANRVFAKLMGVKALKAAGFELNDMERNGKDTTGDFMRMYFGSDDAKTQNRHLRRQIVKRDK